MTDIVERLRTHFKGVDDKGLGSSTFDLVQNSPTRSNGCGRNSMLTRQKARRTFECLR